ncbi:phosphoribosylaminoimidazolesuccinocarboxamide synthase [Candidatus Marinamargulisbacteria bacterium SCGC AG-439-L15]|nr:phosphoribosylaminoimidazolesuccinocarboxamide synthase [Candidatus Marinamargulisbacteria bacterium SCGC AG-439-L15]
METKTKKVITDIQLPNLKLFKTGKVRSVYDFDDKLLIVASDRVSSFDVVLDQGIPHKGDVLTGISKYWFDTLKMPHHLISTYVDDYPDDAKKYRDVLEGRSMLVKKTELIEVECVVRGYLVGSGWKDYQKTGEVCGHKLPEGLQLGQKLPEPIFTPASKAQQGEHDENISIARMEDLIGKELTEVLKNRSLGIYEQACDIAAKKGIIIADTKFEFGMIDSGILLIDEVLTPDSSRFWPADKYEVGISPPSFDKQIVRDYLETLDWNKKAPAPELPQEIITKTSNEYLKIQKLLTT